MIRTFPVALLALVHAGTPIAAQQVPRPSALVLLEPMSPGDQLAGLSLASRFGWRLGRLAGNHHGAAELEGHLGLRDFASELAFTIRSTPGRSLISRGALEYVGAVRDGHGLYATSIAVASEPSPGAAGLRFGITVDHVAVSSASYLSPSVVLAGHSRLSGFSVEGSVRVGTLSMIRDGTGGIDTLGAHPTRGDSSSASPRRAYVTTDARLSIGRSLGAWYVHGSGGLVLLTGRSAQLYGGLAVEHQLRPGFGTVAALSTRVIEPVQGIRRAALHLGFKISGTRETAPTRQDDSRAAAMELVERSGDSVRVAIQAAFARRVELMGDLTGWQPVELRRGSRGTWHARFAVAPGVYRVMLRIDGTAWVVPEGMTRSADPYGAPVGLLLIP